jgi:hypothetical protein
MYITKAYKTKYGTFWTHSCAEKKLAEMDSYDVIQEIFVLCDQTGRVFKMEQIEVQ